MKKTEINQLFKLLTEENPEYALIYKLIYIYARQTKELLQLQKQDINIKKNTITFKINNKEVIFPIATDIHDEILEKIKPLKQKEYIFIDDKKEIDKLTSNLNNFLNRRLMKFNRHYNFDCNKLSLTELRKLRGQHLFLDGVNLITIQKVLQHKNITNLKDFLDYDNIINIKFPGSSMDSLFEDYTNLNIFPIENYNPDEIYTAIDSKGNECTVIVSFNTIDVVENTKIAVKVLKIDEGYLLHQLSQLMPGQYTIIDNIQFMKF